MARCRNLKPSFFLNTELAKIEPLGRLLFAGLWCIADREGRIEDNFVKIKAQLLPYDTADVDQLLTLLHTSKFIIRYKKRSEKCIQIINFLKHQSPHIKEAKSTLPAPDKHRTSPIQKSPHPSSLVSSLPLTSNPPIPLPGGEIVFNPEAAFEKVWKFYPRPLGKKAAFTHFKKSVGSKEDLKRIAGAMDNYISHIEAKKVEEKFIQHGSTWFNNWQDWENYDGSKNEI